MNMNMNVSNRLFGTGTFNMPEHLLGVPALRTVGLGFSEVNFDTKREPTNWSFKSSADADINWKDIKGSLDYAEPLALVTRKFKDGSEEKYVVLSKELENKAFDTGLHVDCPSVIAEVAKRVYWIDNNFSEWVAWVKDVKAAKWSDSIKSTVKVILPTI